ncbi:unnamed protein product [Kuraishia capsulata CBS 1993]|uniref:Uncharacterized protein n=1 Tax=Kuraishia capsulata CBS 1993 TaxID=1382522 RepID=W6MNF3_9ASCO|nr:uncharacterized protein KUCA_T00004137001 [Kuraishia capsulata CBS 1993]CDK28156.1 unnamed protein product [Kuraishia capsulata CBS 1993]
MGVQLAHTVNTQAMKHLKKTLLALVVSSDELRSLEWIGGGSMALLLERYAVLLESLETELNSKDSRSFRPVLIRMVRNLTRCSVLLGIILNGVFAPILARNGHRLHTTDRFYYSRRNLARLTASISVLLSIKPVILRMIARLNLGKLPESFLANLATIGGAVALYPNHALYQKHYLSVYFSVLFLELGYKLLEQIRPEKFKRELAKWSSGNVFFRSWYLFPLCFSQIYRNFVLDRDSCPRYCTKLLENLSTGLYEDGDSGSLCLAYFPQKVFGLLKYAFPAMVGLSLRDNMKPKELIKASFLRSAKMVVFLVGLGSSSLYLTKNNAFSRLSTSARLQLIGFLTGCSAALFANNAGTTYRSVWLYVLRLTLVSSTKAYSQDSKSRFHAFKIDKLLLALSASGILTINDFYKSREDLLDHVAKSKSIKKLAKVIDTGSLLV